MKKSVLILIIMALGSSEAGCSSSKSGSANDTTMNYKVDVWVAKDTMKVDSMTMDTAYK